ncbi:DNA repair protein complementing XP-C cells homolog [Anopheles cruzii]|uniref:DNA repair protein complementing XP-C cells homolog n=1 Tax=Anopheles cruzii TaxID=68878 RepID=UPI0022EC8530|nr:DNA repair protein complementing XP-C cells homolog [Anopheles cruzii]
MSDEEKDVTQSEEEEVDFSASEDEWLPSKKSSQKQGTKRAITATSSEDDSDLEDFEVGSKKQDKKKSSSRKRPTPSSSSAARQTSGQAGKKKRLSPGLRDRLYQQYKNDLLKELHPAKAPLNSSVMDILQKCQFKRKPTIGGGEKKSVGAEDDYDSCSSGDDHLADPEKLDLRSNFFNKKESKQASGSGEAAAAATATATATAPYFDVNAGMRLSDSSEGEDEEIGEGPLPASIPKQAADKLISHINQQSCEFMNFNNLDQFTAKVEEAKRLLINYQQREASEKQQMTDELTSTSERHQESVSNLLAQGEVTGGILPAKVTQSGASTDSEWEEVETGEAADGQKAETKNEEGGWQVTIELDNAQSRRKRREELEMELYIRRQINKVKRANQLNYHKVSVLLAIAIGQRLNRTAGSARVRGLLLSTMNETDCSIKGKWNTMRVAKLADRFCDEFTLQSYDMVGPSTGCDTRFALSLAIYTRKVQCRRDFMLLFLTYLRLAGAQARLVLCATVPSKRPAMSDLCPISERQIKEKFEKRLSAGSEKEQVKTEIGSTVKSTSPRVPPNKADKNSRIDDLKEEDGSIRTTKENSAVPRRSPRNAKRTVEMSPPQKRITRKALATLNIPQLDGGDDIQCGTGPIKSLRRSTRAKSATEAASPGTSPFAKRQSNTTKVILDAKSISTSQVTTAARKKTLFPKETVETEQTQTGAAKRITRSSSQQHSQNTDDGTANKEPPVKRRITRRREPPSDDDEAFELPARKEQQKSRKKPTATVKVSLKSKKGQAKDQKDDNNNGKIPAVVVENIANTGQSKRTNFSIKKSRRATTPQTGARKKINFPAPNSDVDSDFDVAKASSNRKPKRQSATAAKAKRSPIGKGEQGGPNSNKLDLWIEFYCEHSKRWITYDIGSGKIDCIDYIVRNAPNPISYVFAWNNEGHVKDVTARYVQKWNTACRMLRVEQSWLDRALASLIGPKTDRDQLEDVELNKFDANKPLPKTIGELKNHPLYALRRHLLKFEAIHPPEPPTLGFIRGEAIYPRECVHTLQTREKWYKQGRVVCAFETAYKVVKCWKYDRPTNTWLKDQPCDLFGLWQTDEYDPPTAENGIVPRNVYGNVELFTEKMLPKRTVHLKLPGLNRVCKRLRIDCATAITGFEMAKMRMVPVYDGFVVCEEFAEKVVEEWYKEMEEEERREQEKKEKRIYGNWKRLIKGLLLRRKLQNKYNFDNIA